MTRPKRVRFLDDIFPTTYDVDRLNWSINGVPYAYSQKPWVRQIPLLKSPRHARFGPAPIPTSGHSRYVGRLIGHTPSGHPIFVRGGGKQSGMASKK
jgi:hypothetical protein